MNKKGTLRMDRKKPEMTALDQMVATRQGQLLKATLPYLGPPQQQMVSLYAKILELKNTWEIFGASPVRMCEAPQSSDPLEMLNDLKNYCDEPTCRQIDSLVNTLATLEIINLMKSS